MLHINDTAPKDKSKEPRPLGPGYRLDPRERQDAGGVFWNGSLTHFLTEGVRWSGRVGDALRSARDGDPWPSG